MLGDLDDFPIPEMRHLSPESWYADVQKRLLPCTPEMSFCQSNERGLLEGGTVTNTSM